MPLLSHMEQYVTATLTVTATSSIAMFRYASVKGQVQGFEGPGRLQALLQAPSAVQEPGLCFSNICVT